jgi:hypothetical protein
MSPFGFLNPQFDILIFLAPIKTNTQVRNALIIARLLTGDMGYKRKTIATPFLIFYVVVQSYTPIPVKQQFLLHLSLPF